MTTQEGGNFEPFLIFVMAFLRLRGRRGRALLNRGLLALGPLCGLPFAVARHPVDQRIDPETPLTIRAGLLRCGSAMLRLLLLAGLRLGCCALCRFAQTRKCFGRRCAGRAGCDVFFHLLGLDLFVARLELRDLRAIGGRGKAGPQRCMPCRAVLCKLMPAQAKGE